MTPSEIAETLAAMSKIEPRLHHVTIVSQPMVRNFSTGGGHGPADTLVEGDGKLARRAT